MSAPKLEDLIPPPVEINDTNKVHSVANACIALGVLGTLSVAVRVGVRVGHGNLGADDYAIVVAVVGNTLFCLELPMALALLVTDDSNCIIGVLYRMDGIRSVFQSQCWHRETLMGDYCRRILTLLAG